jgi:hypothetical protein
MELLQGKLAVWLSQLLLLIYSLSLVVLLPNRDAIDYEMWLVLVVLIQLMPVMSFGYSETMTRYISVMNNDIPRNYPKFISGWDNSHIRGYLLSEAVYSLVLSTILTLLAFIFVENKMFKAVIFFFCIRSFSQYINHCLINIASARSDISFLRKLEAGSIVVRIFVLVLIWDSLSLNLLFIVESLSILAVSSIYFIQRIGLGLHSKIELRRTDRQVLNFGLVLLFGYLVSYFSTYALSLINSALIVSYLFTLRFVNAMRTFISVILVPKIAETNSKLASVDSFNEHVAIIRSTLLLAGSITTLFLLFVYATKFLRLEGLHFYWLPLPWMVVIILKMYLDIYQGVTSQLTYTKNEIPYIRIVLTSIIVMTFFVLLAISKKSDVLAILSVPIALTLTTYWYIPRYYRRVILRVNLWEYLKKLLFS